MFVFSVCSQVFLFHCVEVHGFYVMLVADPASLSEPGKHEVKSPTGLSVLCVPGLGPSSLSHQKCFYRTMKRHIAEQLEQT